MADVNANIGVHIDTSATIAQLKALRAEISRFNQSVSKSSAAAAIAQRDLQTNLLNAINATGKFHARMGLIRTSTESFTHALETNKLSMREYFRYAGGATTTFRKLFAKEFDTINQVAQSRVKQLQTQYIKLGRDASGAMKAISITPTTLNMKDYGTQVAIAAQRQALLNQLLKQGSTNLLNFGKNTQWAGRQLMVGFTIPLAYFGTAASKVFMDLEAQALKFRRVYGDMFTTTEQTNKALNDIRLLAEEFTKYGVAVAQTMEMAASAAAMGKTGAELTAQVAQATRLAVLGNVEQEQALQTTISLTNAFGLAAEDLSSKINFLNAVENQTITAIEDLTIAIPKAGPVVESLGGSVEDLAFFLTAMREGGINASEGANALKSGLASLINPTDKARGMLADMGISIDAIVEQNFGNLRETVIDFAQALDQLSPLERSRAIEQLFGKFQFARLDALFTNVTKEGGQAARVLDLAGKSIEELAILSERELKAVEDAVGTNFRSAVEQLKLAIAPIGETFLKTVTPFIQGIGNILEKFNNLSDGTKKFIVIATTLVGLIGPTFLMTFGLLANGVANIIKLFALMRNGFLRLTGNSAVLAEQTNYLTKEQMEAATVAAALDQAHNRLTQRFTSEAAALEALRAAFDRATAAQVRFAASNPGMMMPGFKPGIKGGGSGTKFASGTTEVVGGQAGKDSVPALLMPGEAVVPTDIAQDERFKPLIAALVTGQIAKFGEGDVNVGGKTYSARSQSAALNLQKKISQLLGMGISESKIIAALDKNIERGRPMTASALEKRLSIGRGSSAGTSAPSAIKRLARESQSGFREETKVIKKILKQKGITISPAQERNLFAVQASHIEEVRNAGVKQWNAANLVADLGYVNNYLNTVKGNLGKNLLSMSDDQLKSLGIDRNELKSLQSGRHPTTAKAAETLRAVARYDASINPRSYQANAVLAGLEYRSKTNFYAKPLRTLADIAKIRKTPATFAVSKGEKVKTTEGKVATVTGQTGIKKPSGMKVVGGGAADRRVISGANIASIFPRGFKGPRLVGAGAQGGFGEGTAVTPAGFRGGGSGTVGSITAGTRQSETKLKQSIDNLSEENNKTAAASKTIGQKFVTGANVFSGLTIAGSFMGGKIGEISQKLAPLAIALSTITMLAGPMKAGMIKFAGFLAMNPFAPLILAITAAVIGFKFIDSRNKKMAKAQSDYVEAVSATTEKMKKVGEITGQVGASEIMRRRREGETADKFITGYDRAGQQFGTSFLESDVGKGIYETFSKNFQTAGSSAVKQISLELSAYVSDGLMSAEDANSVARSIGVNMSDMTIAANIQGELRSIIGPNGEDLATDPLKVRLAIIQEQQNVFGDVVDQLKAAYANSGFATSDQKNFAAALGATGAQSLEIIQAQRDAQNKLYDDKIRELEAQKANTKDKEKQQKIENEISGLRQQQKSDDAKLAQERQNLLKDQQKAYDLIKKTEKFSFDKPGEVAMFRGLQEQVRTKFKGTGQEPFIESFIGKAKGTQSKDLELTLTTLVGAGDLTPSAAIKLIDMFGKEKEAELETVINSKVALQNPDKFAQLSNIAGGLKGKGSKKVSLELMTKMTAEGQEGAFEDRLAALTLLQKMDGKEINLAAFLQGDALGKIDKLVPMLNEVEKIKTPITKEVIQNLSQNEALKALGPNAFSALAADWEHYVNLPAETQKTAVETFVTVYETIGAKEREQFAINKAGGATSGSVYDYWMGQSTSKIAAELTKEQFPAGKDKNVIPKGSKGGKDGSGTDPFEDLNKKLRTLRDFTISASGGLEQLKKIFKGDNSIKKFSGSLQDLAAGPKGGINRSFLEYISDLDQKTFLSLINQKKFKKGILELNDTGKAIKDTFNAIDLGAFQSQFAIGAQNTLAQQSAFIKLKNAGVDTFTAMELVSNEELAVAINAEKSTGSIKGLVDSFKAAENATSEFDVALQNSLINDIKDFNLLKSMPKLVDQMKSLGLNADQIKAVLDNPQLAKGLMKDLEDGKLDSELIADYLNSIPSKKIIQIDIQMKTPEGQYDIFKQGFSEAMDFFDAQEALITQERAPGLEKITNEIEDLQNKIAAAETKIKPFEQAISDLQYKLDYDPDFGSGAIDALKEKIDKERKEIEKLNDQIDKYRQEIEKRQRFIEINFERPIQALQDESNILSNTLSLIERQEQSINEKYDLQAKALEKVSEANQEILAQEKQRLSIADALTQGDISAAAQAAQEARAQAASAAAQRAGGVLDAARQAELGRVTVNGMSRSQIEERQFQIGQQIFNLEQKRKVIDSEILYYQDEIYKVQQAQIPFQVAIKDLETQIEAKEAQRSIWTKEIATNQFEIDRIKRLEIEPSQLLLEKAELARDAYIKQTEKLFESLDYLGRTKEQWIKTNVEIDAAKTKGESLAKTMEANAAIVSAIASNWKSIESKTVTLTVNTVYTSTGTTGTTGTDSTKYGSFKAKMYGGKIKGYAGGGKIKPLYRPMGGLIPYMADGGFRPMGSDTVPAMLTPGEYVVNKASTKAFLPFLSAINESKYPSMIARKMQSAAPVMLNTSLVSPSYNVSTPNISASATNIANASYSDNSNTVYNYSVGISVGGTNASPDSIAQTVMNEIKYLDSQRVRKQRVS